MPNRLAELERTVRERRRKSKAKKPASAGAPRPMPSATRPPGQSLSAVLGRRARRASRAFSGPVDYAIPGPIDVVAQPTRNTCWAAAFTMLYGWKRQQSMAIETALGNIGQRWVDLFTADRGLSTSDKADLVAAAQLEPHQGVNFSVEGWEQLLRNYGPLWVTTDERPGRPGGIHARILTAIKGDGTPAGTKLHFINPSGGREGDERVDEFIPKFEAEVAETGRIRIQVLHWMANARSEGQSLTLTRIRPVSRGFSRPVVRAFETVDQVRTRLRAQGVPDAEMEAFLKEIGATSMALAVPASATPVRFPPARLVSAWQSELISAALSTSPLAGMVPAVRALARATGTTIGIGPSITGGMVAGFTAGAGVLFASDGRIGLYGSAGGVMGAIFSIGASIQVTVVRGGPDVFGGEGMSVAITIDTAVGPSIGAHALFNQSGFIGVTGEVGLSLGLSPFEAFASYQWTGTTLSVAHPTRARGRIPLRARAFVAGPGTPTEEERQVAREILEYFYPGMVRNGIGSDHVRLAGAMLAAAIEKQRWLDRLPQPPGSKPGFGWLVSSGVRILWNELRGPAGLSEPSRATVALQWRTTFDEIRNGLEPTALSLAPETFSLVEAYSDIPLDPGAGGQSILVEACEKGDIILSTTSAPESRLIRFGMGSEISHAGLYVGNGEMAESVASGVRIARVQDAQMDNNTTVMVAFRYPGLTSAQQDAIATFARQQVGRKYDYVGIVRQAPFQLAQRWCRSLDGAMQERCRRWTGRVFLGTDTNDTFFCSELVVAAYQHAGVPLTREVPSWTSPQDLRELHLSQKLGYVGHLKTP